MYCLGLIKLCSQWCSALLTESCIRSCTSLQRPHNEHDGISNHWLLGCLLNHLFRCRSKKTSMLCVTGLCERNPLLTGGFPSQRFSNMENVSIWRSHHVIFHSIALLEHSLTLRMLWYFPICRWPFWMTLYGSIKYTISYIAMESKEKKITCITL